MDVSENSGTPKSSVLIGLSIINHPFWGTPIFGNIHVYINILYIYLSIQMFWPTKVMNGAPQNSTPFRNTKVFYFLPQLDLLRHFEMECFSWSEGDISSQFEGITQPKTNIAPEESKGWKRWKMGFLLGIAFVLGEVLIVSGSVDGLEWYTSLCMYRYYYVVLAHSIERWISRMTS